MERNEYIKIFMEYESDDMPVIYLYEVDLENERLALRAIEIFINRRVKSIDNLYQIVLLVGGIFLAWKKRIIQNYWGTCRNQAGNG